jgi:polyhydroxyalkanoate synthesis repressor PhaR
MTTKQAGDRLIKKYPNRRLYDTATSTYVTLLDVKRLVLEQQTFKVVDAKNGDDLTRSILLQIILDEESGGVPMFSSAMLSQIIRLYGHAMQGLMGRYLETTIQNFIDFQRVLAEQSGQALGSAPLNPLHQLNPLNPEHWASYLSRTSPAAQTAMSRYVEQSRDMMAEMQARMLEQSKGAFPGFPAAFPADFSGFPGFPGASAASGDSREPGAEGAASVSPSAEKAADSDKAD